MCIYIVYINKYTYIYIYIYMYVCFYLHMFIHVFGLQAGRAWRARGLLWMFPVVAAWGRDVVAAS